MEDRVRAETGSRVEIHKDHRGLSIRGLHGIPLPKVDRVRGVLIPSAWQVLASAVLEEADASLAARKLAQLVREAAEATAG